MTTPSPYPGLRPFEQNEAHLFFGRETQVEDMLGRLEQQRFLAVVGSSGCGKSSLVKAGLIPALKQGFLSDAEPHWRMAVMRPGNAPFDNLTQALMEASALGCERGQGTRAEAVLQATLRRGPLGLREAVAESHLPQDPDQGSNLLLLVDQFEEIFRYRKQRTSVIDADAFVALLLASVQTQPSAVPIYVVITMRSDFIGDCAWFNGLPEAINNSQFLTPRLTRDQYRASIIEPAQLQGGGLSNALVNRLLNDLRGDPDQLPVLQHALMRMWTTADRSASAPTLAVEDYQAVGGLAGALSKHCDEILNHFDEQQQRIAEVMFRALCERSTDQRDTRRPVALGKVAAVAGVTDEAVRPVVDAFRGAGRNFLTPPLPTKLNADTPLDISHESLIRQWQILNEWVVAEAESARQYLRLKDVVKRRQREGQGAELWRGVDLINARAWKDKETLTQAWASRYGDEDTYPLVMEFLEDSEAAEQKLLQDQDQAQKRELKQARELAEALKARAKAQANAASRSNKLTGIIAVLLVCAVVTAVYAFVQKYYADKQFEQLLASEAAVLWHPLDFTSSSGNFSEKQAQGLLKLARSDELRKRAFLGQLLTNKNLAGRFNKQPALILNAAMGLNLKRRSWFLEQLYEIAPEDQTRKQLSRVRYLALSELDGKLALEEIIAVIQGTNDYDQLEVLGQSVAAVVGKMPEAQAGVVMETFVAAMQGTKDYNQLKALIQGMAAVPGKLTETQAGAVAETFVAAIQGTKDYSQLEALGQGVAAVAGKMPEAQAGAVAETFVAAMQGTKDSYQLEILGKSVATMAGKVPIAQAGTVLEMFLVAMQGRKDSDQLEALEQGVTAMAGKVPKAQAGAVAEMFVATILGTENSSQLSSLQDGVLVVASAMSNDSQVASLLFKLLKNPLFPRNKLTDAIRKHFQDAPPAEQGFWALIKWADERFPHLDLDAPLKEPASSAAVSSSPKSNPVQHG